MKSNAQFSSNNTFTIPYNLIDSQGSCVNIANCLAKITKDEFNVNNEIKIYCTYNNNSNQNIIAVQFRFIIRDNKNLIVKSFLASDSSVTFPNSQSQAKWRFNGIIKDPALCQVKILKVKFADLTIWNNPNSTEPSDINNH